MPTGQRFFAFIRAINTGARRLTNDQLIEPFVRLGFDDVAAYQAAGNITFRSGDLDAVQPERLERALAEAYGFDTPTFVRNGDELRGLIDGSPFTDNDIAGTEGRIQVCFLRAVPNDEAVTVVRALVPPDDRVEFSGQEWFWLPTKDIRDSRLPISPIEHILGPMTIRTLGTISRMLDKFDQ